MMAISSIALFLAQHAASSALDMLIKRITGETKKRDAFERATLETTKRIDERQLEILEILYEQLEVRFRVALHSLENALTCDSSSTSFRENVRVAIYEFTYCTELKYFSGLRKAQMYVYLAICQSLLNEDRNALASFREAKKVAVATASEKTATYIREESAASFTIQLPSGTTVSGESWQLRKVPWIQAEAFQLAKEIELALAKDQRT